MGSLDLSVKLIDIAVGAAYAHVMLSQPKQTVERDEKYLQFVRSLPCTVCNHPAPSHAHHHPPAGQSSTGLKTSDYRTVPLCGTRCHDLLHCVGRHTFWAGVNVELIISQLNASFFMGQM